MCICGQEVVCEHGWFNISKQFGFVFVMSSTVVGPKMQMSGQNGNLKQAFHLKLKLDNFSNKNLGLNPSNTFHHAQTGQLVTFSKVIVCCMSNN